MKKYIFLFNKNYITFSGLNWGGSGKTLQQGEKTEQLLLGKGSIIQNSILRPKKSESDIESWKKSESDIELWQRSSSVGNSKKNLRIWHWKFQQSDIKSWKQLVKPSPSLLQRLQTLWKALTSWYRWTNCFEDDDHDVDGHDHDLSFQCQDYEKYLAEIGTGPLSRVMVMRASVVVNITQVLIEMLNSDSLF